MEAEKLKLGTIGQDGCCCGEVKTKDYVIITHCWRGSRVCCRFAGVHFEGADSEAMLKHAHDIAEYISESYRTDVNLSPSKA